MKQSDKECYYLCNSCGKLAYPKADFSQMGGITLSIGTCPKCGKNNQTLTPVRDYRAASGEDLMWD